MDSGSPFEIITKYQTAPPVSVELIARDLGLNISYTDLGPQISGCLLRDKTKGGSSGFVILINSTDAVVRKRFTAAHELAHYILHRDLIDSGVTDDIFYRSPELSGFHEVQANKLAADILMPIRLIKSALQVTQEPAKLAEQFQVSLQAMEIQLKDFGFISRDAANSRRNPPTASVS